MPVVIALLERRGVLISGGRCAIAFLEERNVVPLLSGGGPRLGGDVLGDFRLRALRGGDLERLISQDVIL